MRVHPLISSVGTFCLLMIGPTHAEETDPFGYTTMHLPAGARGLLGIPLAEYYNFKGEVVAVNGGELTFASDLPGNALGEVGEGFLNVRSGDQRGMVFGITEVSGPKVVLKDPAQGWIAPGDLVDIRPEMTLGAIFEGGISNLQTGEDETEADTVSIWDAENQISKVFYFKSGQGWRLAGHEDEGDQSGVVVRYSTALIFERRGDTDLEFVNVGAVPVPFFERIIRVWPGRNVISAPFSSVSSLQDWGLHKEGSPLSLVGGASAAKADTVRLTYVDGSKSEVIYYRNGRGWRAAGLDGDAGDTPVGFHQAIDLQRHGKGGWIRIDGSPEESAFSLAADVGPVEEVPRFTTDVDGMTATLSWDAEPGASYQVQSLSAGSLEWSDRGLPVLAQTRVCRTELGLSGSGRLRIIILP